MARLLGQEWIGGRLRKDWLHVGEDNRDKITTEIIQAVDPVFESIKRSAQMEKPKAQFRLKARIPSTLLEDTAKTSAALWGVKYLDAFAEIMQQKTDRAKKALKILTDGSDYSKIQAKTYR